LLLLNHIQNLPPQALLLKAYLEKAAGNLEAAYGLLGKVEKLAMEHGDSQLANAGFYLTYATICELMGKVDEAIDKLRVAYKLAPDAPDTANSLGYVLCDHDRELVYAEELIRKALLQRPDSAAYLDSLAWVCFKQGKYPEAQEAMASCLKAGGMEDDPDGTTLAHAAAICDANGLPELAALYRRWLMVINPDYHE
jgi:tetratricopeptide (TPR) repeat protein